LPLAVTVVIGFVIAACIAASMRCSLSDFTSGGGARWLLGDPPKSIALPRKEDVNVGTLPTGSTLGDFALTSNFSKEFRSVDHLLGAGAADAALGCALPCAVGSILDDDGDCPALLVIGVVGTALLSTGLLL
jgi:hypothetical protein